jgi:hypothetical protein
MLVLFVLALAALLGFAAMTIDLGLLFEDRRHLQNSADAAALAGVVELPLKPVAARQKAQEWAASNGVPASQIKKIEIRTTEAANDTLYVELEKPFTWIFGQPLGLSMDPVSASAAAQIRSLRGTSKLMPWAILMGDSACLDSANKPISGANCAVKLGAGASTIGGWYGALDLDGAGGGSSEYESNIIDGTAATKYCSVGQTDPDCQSFVVDALPGNKVGGTDHAINERLLNEPTCDANGNRIDDFGEVFVPGQNGFAQFAVVCPQSPRYVIIPIVTPNQIPVKTVTINGWALAYLEGYSCVGAVNCTGGKGHWEVSVTMVDAIYSTSPDLIGPFNPLSRVAVRRLIE